MKITGEMVVFALRALGRSVQAKHIAMQLGTDDTRAVATAARKPAKDGRITCRYPKGRNVATYRFVRLRAQHRGDSRGGEG